MKTEKLEVVRGSGNVFRDLGHKNADAEQFKGILAAEIIKALDRERLTVRAAPLFSVSPHYAQVVAAAFAHRRKTLRNALGRLLSRDQIAACGLDPGARPETLTPQEFNTLAQVLDRTHV